MPPPSDTKRAIVLLSGGLDSATCLAIARSQGFECHCLSFRYGQRHLHELDCAARVANALGAARHVTLTIDLRQFGGSALTADIAVPKHATVEEMTADSHTSVITDGSGTSASVGGIPITYVPARNTIFLSFAIAMAETTGASDIFIGVNALDYSGYPDCRPEYIAAFQTLANLATRAGVEGAHRLRIHTPLIELTKRQIISRGLDLGVDFALTSTCYDPDPTTGAGCRHCDACLLRLKGFAENNTPDPAAYVAMT